MGARPPRQCEGMGRCFSLALILPVLLPACSPLATQPDTQDFFGRWGWEPDEAGLVPWGPRGPSLLLGCYGAEAAPAGGGSGGDPWAGLRQLRSRIAGRMPCPGEAPHGAPPAFRGKGCLVTKTQLTRGTGGGGEVGLPGFSPTKEQECSGHLVPQPEARNGTWGLNRGMGRAGKGGASCWGESKNLPTHSWGGTVPP